MIGTLITELHFLLDLLELTNENGKYPRYFTVGERTMIHQRRAAIYTALDELEEDEIELPEFRYVLPEHIKNKIKWIEKIENYD